MGMRGWVGMRCNHHVEEDRVGPVEEFLRAELHGQGPVVTLVVCLRTLTFADFS